MADLFQDLKQLSPAILEVRTPEGFDTLDLIQVSVKGADAFEVWQALRAAVPRTQRWPVIVGGGEDLLSDLRQSIEFTAEHLNHRKNQTFTLRERANEWLAEAERTPYDEWLRRQRDPQSKAAEHRAQADELERLGGPPSLIKHHREWAQKIETSEFKPFDPAACVWPEQESPPLTEWHTLVDASTMEWDENGRRTRGPEIFEQVEILLIPSPSGWEAPAFLFFGGFNACPFPEVHVAFARWAAERHHAELVAVNKDMVELIPREPPPDRASAILLARDLQSYGEELQFGGKQTIGEIASALMNRSYWSFWWD